MPHVIRYGVLLVEDDPWLLQATARLFGTAFDVATARSLDEAIAAFVGATAPDVLVTDLALGGEHGEALLHVVLACFPHVVRVALSGNPERLAAVASSGLANVVLEKGARA